MEEWRPVVGYEGLYLASSLGRIMKIGHQRRRDGIIRPLDTPYICKTFLATNGYQMLHLVKDGKRTPKTIHKIICRAFHGEQPHGRWICVRHLDGDSLNNRADNLAWGTYKDNAMDSIRHGRYIGTRLTDDDVRAIRNSDKAIAEIASEYGLNHQYARRIKTGRARSAA